MGQKMIKIDHTREIEGKARLTQGQEGIYFECVENLENLKYNNPNYILLPKDTDIDRFIKAVEKVIKSHKALNVTIEETEDGIFMNANDFDVSVSKTEASSLDKKVHLYQKSFDLYNGPLYRFEVCHIEDRDYLFFDIHHIVYDGTTLKTLIDEICAAYENEDLVIEEKINIFDVSKYEETIKDTPLYKEAQEYYKEKLSAVEFDTNIIPTVNQNNKKKGTTKVTIAAPKSLSIENVLKFKADNKINESTLFMGAFAYALSIFLGSKEASFNTVNHGRHIEGLENTIGFFVKNSPMHFNIDDSIKVVDFLNTVQNDYFKAKDYDLINFSELVSEYNVNLDISFGYQSDLLSGAKLENESIRPILMPYADPQAKILTMLLKTGKGYEIETFVDNECFDKDFARTFNDTVFKVAESMLSAESLKDITLLTKDNEEKIEENNKTEKEYDECETVNSIFDKTAIDNKDDLAIVYKDKQYTYKEVDELSRNIAGYIIEKNIGENDFVSILTHRTYEMPIAAFGVIRAGAAFEPLDPTYPKERLNFMVKDCNAKLLIVDRALRDLVDEYEGDVLFTDEFENLAVVDRELPLCNPSSAFTVIYTSGTTGTPKGSVLENRNLVAFYHSHKEIMGLDNNSHVASYASFGFDAGVMDIVTTLLCGGTLFIIPDDIRLDLLKIDEFYIENKITHGFMTTQVGRMFAENTKCETLKAFLVGGEKLVPFTPKDSFRFINGYGPCETMAYICHFDVKDNSTVQPIGKPSMNTKLYVVDKEGRLLPFYGVGELCISGKQVGRGYLGQEEKTKEVFVDNTFCDDKAYSPMYKSGDIVRLLPDGNIEFIGRKDSQVKIRGFRVELTEVEEIIRRYDDITDATVQAFDEESGGKYLCAYIASDKTIDIEKLKEFIKVEKPPYMVPAVIMQIDAIPYTQNQKVNKRALPKPERVDNFEIVKPSTQMQEEIIALVKEIIGEINFGITNDFFDLGLTSIGTLKLNVNLSKKYNVPVKMSDIKENNTVEKLEAFIKGQSVEEKREVLSDYPLMQNQMGVFVECDMEKETLKYNVPALFRISKEVDVEKLKDAIIKAIACHPYLNAKLFSNDKGEIRAIRQDDKKAVVDVIKLDELSEPSSLLKPFDLLNDTLYRVKILVGKEKNYLFFDIHHIVSDGTSIAILLQDINKIYNGETVEKEKYTGFDAAVDEEKDVKSDKYQRAEEYYENLLSSCNIECLPDKCPQSNENFAKSYTYSIGDYSAEIEKYCKEKNVSENAFFNAVFSFTLAKYLHGDDVTYLTIYNGRNDSRLYDTFSMLVKTLPVRTYVDFNENTLSFVEKMQKQLLDSMSNDMVSFATLASKYGLKSDIFFNYQGDNFNFDNIGNEKAKLINIELKDAKAPLTIQVFKEDGKYSLLTDYMQNCLCIEFVESLMSSIKEAAKGFINCDKLSEIELMSENERAHFDRMNATQKDIEDIPAFKFFERCVEKTPEKIAAITKDDKLTYDELNKKANKVANALVKLGANVGDIVGIVLDRDINIPIVELGIFKAGCAFLPMLPTYPDDRIDFCMVDAKCNYVISTKEIIGKKEELFKGKEYKALAVEDLLLEESDENPNLDIDMQGLAYCIYTSGSTGTPKGVMLEHHNLTNYIQTSEFIRIQEKGSTMLCISSISFDMSMTEIFFSLCHDNSVYIASEEEIHNLDMLLEAFINNTIDMMCITPSFAWNLLSVPEFGMSLSKLQSIILGAEAFQPGLLSKLKRLNPNMLIQNGYGPTECTQACSSQDVISPDNITIGGPFKNTKFYVMDDNKHLLPRYATGELIICGDCVGRGYVNLPEKTKEAFFTLEGIKAYHSGDLVRVNKYNEVEFSGRKDNQVKLRGFRVELSEIESVIEEYDSVTQSKVIVRNNGTEDYLCAYFVASKEIDIDELTQFMKSKLTYYMVPAAMMQLDKMPMTPNGKLDKKALPEITVKKKERTKKKPKKSLEERILDVFKSVLNIEECYVDDNFFEIGGTSLSASKAVMQIKSEGYKIEYQDIFDHQNAEELAEYLESLSKVSEEKKVEVKSDSSLYTQEEWVGKLLEHNTLEFAKEVKREPLGDVLITGATGFLGVHILKAVIDNEEGKIICLMRKGKFDDVKTRLQSTLVYYFEDDFDDLFENRLTVVEGDITEENLKDKLKDVHFDTLINCAASVKHFANDNSIEHINVHGVEILIDVCKEKNAKMIQISTSSVVGAHNDKTYNAGLKMTENTLFVIDDMNNQYCQSKYQAELRMLKAIEEGMRGKIIRVGNLMGRHSDGEFQTNMHTNAFLSALRGFANIGKCPISHCTDPMSFSPVDCTAKAVVFLAGTNDMFTAFHAESRYTFDEMKVMETMNRVGIKITPVPDDEYYSDFYRMMGDPKMNAKISALLTNDRPDMHMVEADNRFTANILYRIGFSWPFIDDAYLEQFFRTLDEFDFFFIEQ